MAGLIESYELLRIAMAGEAVATSNAGAATYNNLAWILATSRFESVRDGQRAVQLAKKACELSEWQAAHMIDTLSAAYAENDDFEAAIESQKKAIEANTQAEAAGAYEASMKLFEKGEKVREAVQWIWPLQFE